jgi:hypothetical protein
VILLDDVRGRASRTDVLGIDGGNAIGVARESRRRAHASALADCLRGTLLKDLTAAVPQEMSLLARDSRACQPLPWSRGRLARCPMSHELRSSFADEPERLVFLAMPSQLDTVHMNGALCGH